LDIGTIGFGLRVFLIAKDAFSKLSPEEQILLYEEKRDNKFAHYSRVIVKPEVREKKIDGTELLVGGKASAITSSFNHHALHGSAPTNRKSRKKKGGMKGRGKTSTNALLGFHANGDFRVKFSGLSGVGRKQKKIDDIATEMFKALVRPISDPDLNETSFVVSEIGCGKSTLLTNLYLSIREYQETEKIEKSAQTLPVEVVLISFDDIPINGDKSAKIYLEKTVKPFIAAQIKRVTSLSGSTFEELMDDRKSQNLILIFDDLDGVYQLYCKKFLTDQNTFNPNLGPQKFSPFVFKLIELFSDGDLSEYGIRCIFGMRIDTLNMLKNNTEPTLDSGTVLTNVKGLYQLHDKRGEGILELVKRRFDLAISLETNGEMVELLRTRRASFRPITAKIFEQISQIGIQGLRHTVYIIQQLAEASVKNDLLFERYFLKEGDLIQFFMSGASQHFSQVNEGVTNIFLINSAYRKDNVPTLSDGEPAFTEEFLIDHKQTYFLKYLILLFIKNTNADRSSVESTFSKIGGYELELVQLVLCSLTDVRHGRLVRPDTSRNVGIEAQKSNGLIVTSRGKYFIENKIFWDFDYLALVIEDHWMEVPNALMQTFENPVGFQHLGIASEAEYKRRLTDFLMQKAITIPTFLHLLDLSLEIELKKKKKLALALQDVGVRLPNFEEISDRCKQQLGERAALAVPAERTKIMKRYAEHSSDTERKRIKQQIGKALKSCY